MSTALAIAGVTAVLRDRLNDGIVNHNIAGLIGNTVTVSVRSPDRVVSRSKTRIRKKNSFKFSLNFNFLLDTLFVSP